MTLSFENKVALVAGATSDMGLPTARAGAGRLQGGRGEAHKLVGAGHRAIAFRWDLSNGTQMAAIVDRTVAEFGRLDAGFNNAGVMTRIAPTPKRGAKTATACSLSTCAEVWSCNGTRTAADGASRQPCNCEQRVGRRLDRQFRYRCLRRIKHGVVGLTRTAAREYNLAGSLCAVCSWPKLTCSLRPSSLLATRRRFHLIASLVSIGFSDGPNPQKSSLSRIWNPVRIRWAEDCFVQATAARAHSFVSSLSRVIVCPTLNDWRISTHAPLRLMFTVKHLSETSLENVPVRKRQQTRFACRGARFIRP